ncbi:MAG: hypothetical protein P4L71_20085 [Acetobacteraceae bacterium]|nr:hypothetical protein [Acetobacteraceae bacterium]
MNDDIKFFDAPDGRKIGWKRLAPGDFMDLMDAVAEPNKTAMGSLGMGSTVASVRSINGVPEPFPRSKSELKALADRLGWDTIQALSAAMGDETAEKVAADAKNSPAPQDSGTP